MSKRVIAVFANYPDAVFQRHVIAGAREIFDRSGYRVSVHEVPASPPHLTELPIKETRLVGVLVITGVLPDSVMIELSERSIPISLVSHQVTGGRVPAVMPNNRQGIATLVEHLVVANGRQKPVFIEGIMSQTDGIQRYHAFKQEVMRYALNVPPEYFLRGEFSPQVAAESMRAFLATGAEFDAVVASDYLMAEAAIREIKASGRRIPDDISVVGFGDGPEAAQAGLTTVAADVTELGRRAARQLIGQINGLRIRGLTLLSAELIERETTFRQSQTTDFA